MKRTMLTKTRKSIAQNERDRLLLPIGDHLQNAMVLLPGGKAHLAVDTKRTLRMIATDRDARPAVENRLGGDRLQDVALEAGLSPTPENLFPLHLQRVLLR
jgi:hypothetical protein